VIRQGTGTARPKWRLLLAQCSRLTVSEVTSARGFPSSRSVLRRGPFEAMAAVLELLAGRNRLPMNGRIKRAL
jgi:hypothetical protein